MNSPEVATTSPPKAPVWCGPFSPSYTRWAMWLLLFVSLLNYLDRQVMNILAEPIRRDLGLNDTQLGLLGGLAFALFYTLLGVPLARLADNPKTTRVGLIAACLALWSAMTAICGLAQNFAQLLLARIGVGVGEAGCTPAAHSLITDMVPREKHASSIAFFGIGGPLGGLLGMVLGGVVTDLYGWRAAFLIVGAPGLLFALFLWAVLKEPRQVIRQSASAIASPPPSLTLRQAVAEVARSKAYRFLMVAGCFAAFLSYGKSMWQAVLFIRIHGLSAGQTGIWLGVTAGVAGALGMLLGGYFADRLGARRPSLIMAAPVIGMVAGAPLLLAGYMEDDWRIALLLIFLPFVANGMHYGPTFSCVQRLVRPAARAMASALMLFVINLIGLGLGPLLFGVISDAVAPWAGNQSVRWVLAGAALLGVVPALFYWLASRHLERELQA